MLTKKIVIPFLIVVISVVLAEENRLFERAEANDTSRIIRPIHRIPRPISKPSLVRIVDITTTTITPPTFSQTPGYNESSVNANSHSSQTLSPRPIPRPTYVSSRQPISFENVLQPSTVSTLHNYPIRKPNLPARPPIMSTMDQPVPDKVYITSTTIKNEKEIIVTPSPVAYGSSLPPPKTFYQRPILQSRPIPRPINMGTLTTLKPNLHLDTSNNASPTEIVETTSTMGNLVNELHIGTERDPLEDEVRESTNAPLNQLNQNQLQLNDLNSNSQKPLSPARPIPSPITVERLTTAKPDILLDNSPPSVIIADDLTNLGSASVNPSYEPRPSLPSQLLPTEEQPMTKRPIATDLPAPENTISIQQRPTVSSKLPMVRPSPVQDSEWKHISNPGWVPMTVPTATSKPVQSGPISKSSVFLQTTKPYPIQKLTTMKPTPVTLPLSHIVNIKCEKENGYFYAGQECDTYIECKKNVASEYLCPDGLHFNINAVWPEYPCAYPSEVECMGRPLKYGPNPTGECPRQYGFFPMGKGDCSRYIMCQEGIATIMDCPSGLVFNTDVSACDWPEKVPNCQPEVFQGFRCPAAPLDEDGKTSDIVINYRFGTSCKNYVACQRGSPRLLSCDPGFSFEAESGYCVESDYVTNCV